MKKKAVNGQTIKGIIKACRNIMRKDKGINSDLDRLPHLIWIMFLKFLDDDEKIREVEAEVSGKKYIQSIQLPYRWRDWALDPTGITGNELIKFINNEDAIRPDGSKGPGLFAYLRSLSGEPGSRKEIVSKVFNGTNNRLLNGYLIRDVINKINQIDFTSNEQVNILSFLYETLLKELRDAAGTSGEFYTPRAVIELMVHLINPQLGENIVDPAAGTGGFLVETFDHLEKQCQSVEDMQILHKHSIFGGEAKPLPYLLCQMNLLLHGLKFVKINYGNSLGRPLREIGERERVDIILTNPPFGGEEETGILSNFPINLRTKETSLLFLQLIMRKLKRTKEGNKGGRCGIILPDNFLFGDGVFQKVKIKLLRDFNLHTIIRLPMGVFAPYTAIPTNILLFEAGGPTKEIWYYEHPIPSDRKSYSKTRPLEFDEFENVIKWYNDRAENDYFWKVTIEEVVGNDYNLDIKNPKKIFIQYNPPEEILNSIQILDNNLKNLIEILMNEIKLEYLDLTKWETTPLKDILTQKKEIEKIQLTKKYRLMGLRQEGNGPFIREEKYGSEIKAKGLYKVSTNDFVYSRLFAWKGSFTTISEDFNGAYVSSEFPIFIVNKNVEPRFLELFFNQERVWLEVDRKSKGVTKQSRNRFYESKFMEMEIRLPPIKIQKKLIERIDKMKELNRLLSKMKKMTPKLNFSILNDAFKVNEQFGKKEAKIIKEMPLDNWIKKES